MDSRYSEERCPECKSHLIFTETQSSVHYGRLDCPKCRKFIRWVKNPKKEKVRSRTSKYKIKDIVEYHKFEEAFCFFCLRTKEQLGEKETLTIDHIKELNEGGTNGIENLQILCSACHKLKNWCRLYVNWHLNKKKRKENDS